MLFKDIKIGYPIYFLDKEGARYYQGKAVSVAVPRYDNNQSKAFGAQPTGLVVDITIEADGATKTYTIPETATITYAGHLVLSTDKDGILRDKRIEGIENEVKSLGAVLRDFINEFKK